jgi:hypothetical protein
MWRSSVMPLVRDVAQALLPASVGTLADVQRRSRQYRPLLFSTPFPQDARHGGADSFIMTVELPEKQGGDLDRHVAPIGII